MLQEIAPKQYHVEFAFRAPKESGRCVVFRGMEILERLQDGQLFLPTYGELQDRVAECCYLFRIDEEEYYLTSLQETASVPEGYAGGVSERAGQRKPGTCILQRPRPTISPFGTGTIASVDGVGKEPSRTARSACFAVRTAEI